MINYFVCLTFDCSNLKKNRKKRRARKDPLVVPGTNNHSSRIRRIAGRFGLDFIVAGVKFFNRQLGEIDRIYIKIRNIPRSF